MFKKLCSIIMSVIFLGSASIPVVALERYSLAPHSMFGNKFVPLPTPVEDHELTQKIDPVVGSKRGLIVTDSVDAIDQALSIKAAKSGVKYLRLTLRDQRELDSLMTRVHIHEGSYDVSGGAIPEIITGGGILLIDYSGSIPQFIEQFNSLFDKFPYFEKYRALEKLTIIGVMNPAQFAQSDSTFRSRFVESFAIPARYVDPVDAIRAPPEGADALSVELSGSPRYKDELFGRAYLDQNGTIQLQEGPLIRAVREDRPLVIKGDVWNDPAFLDFIRQVILNKAVTCNGETVPLPKNFTLYRASGDYREGMVNKQIIALEETKVPDRPVWVINEQTQDILFSRIHATPDGTLIQLPGILDEPKLRLRVTDNIPDWVWHKIMHAPGEIEVEVGADTLVPAVYASQKSEKAKKTFFEKKRKTWKDVRKAKAVYIEGDDLGFISARIREDVGKEVIVYPVTPETTLTQLIASIEISPFPDKKSRFVSRYKGVIAALREGKTVMLEGIDANPALCAKLAPALSETPYSMVNGERFDMAALAGQLLLTSRPQKAHRVLAENYVEMPSDDAFLSQILKERFPEKFRAGDFEKIKHLREIFKTIPAPSIPGLYPAPVNLSLDRLSMLYRYDDWPNAFEDVVISAYNGAPEVAAFMRVMVRMTFGIDEKGQRSRTINGKKLMNILNGIVPQEGWGPYVWRLADTMSIDLLQESGIGADFLKPVTADMANSIQRALVKNAAGDREKMYRCLFDITGDVSGAALIDDTLPAGEEGWNERKGRAVRALKTFRAAFFRGSPGTGKSFITEEIAREMGYVPEDVVGPINTGVDACETDIVARQVYEAGTSRVVDEAVGEWIPADPQGKEGPPKRNGRLFIVDEANLTKPQFWNFLKAFFNHDPNGCYLWVDGHRRWFVDTDRLIFTGNQETLVGRKFQELIQERMVTVNFAPFDDEFLRERLHEYIDRDKMYRQELIELLLELYRTLETVTPSVSFSLRDLQELAARANVFCGKKWDTASVVLVAWNQCRGMYAANEARALEYILKKKFGIAVVKWERAKHQQIIDDERNVYRMLGVELVGSAARMVASVEDFLKMRRVRMDNTTALQGKRGMIFEGPSGRGKDIFLRRILEKNGFVEAKQSPVGTPAHRKFYHIGAGSRIDEIVSVIRTAREDGSVVIISEMNLLPSAFLEGKLNDILTGNAHQGFALFATMNSEDFSGREKLSTALQNRTIYERIADYPQEELYDIALLNRGTVSERDTRLLTNFHAWVRQGVLPANQKPTTRDILNTFALIEKEKIGWRAAAQRHYGPFYLAQALRGKTIPSDNELRTFIERPLVDNVEVMRLIGSYIIGRPVTIKLDALTKQGGTHSSAEGVITLSTKNSFDYQLDVIDHEGAHGRFTREFAGLTPAASDPFHWLYMWLEDMRIEHALKNFYPYVDLGGINDAEKGFIMAVTMLDIDYLSKMTPQDIYKYLLSTCAKGFISKKDMQDLAEVTEGLYPVNIAAAALKQCEAALEIYACVPATMEQEEVRLQQYRALLLMQPMKDDYVEIQRLSRGAAEKAEGGEEPSLDEQMSEINQTLGAIENADMHPREGVGLSIAKAQWALRVRAAGKKSLINTKIEVLRKQKEAVMRMTREEILNEFALMATDLSVPELVTPERLREMLNQLQNRLHPASLVARIEQMHDEYIDLYATQLIERIKATGEGNELRAAEEGMWYEGSSKKKGGSWGVSVLGMGPMIGARYPVAAAHKEDMRRNPIAVIPEKPKPVLVSLAVAETSQPDLALARIIVVARPLLDLAISNFFKRTLSVEKIYGQEGSLDVERFLTGNPVTAFYRSGGAEEKDCKEIVLAGRAGPGEWNVITRELFRFLFENGFRVTVYTSAGAYVENIRTLADLKKILVTAQNVDGQKVKEDLALRKRSEDYVYTSLKEVQKRAEAAYLYGAMKALPLAEASKPAGNVGKELSFAEQVEDAKKFLKDNNLPDDTLSIEPVAERFSLDLSGTTITDLSGLARLKNLKELILVDNRAVRDLRPLAGLVNLETLQLGGTAITDLSGIEGLQNLKTISLIDNTEIRDLNNLTLVPNLLMVFLPETAVPDEQIYELFRAHPNREKLSVLNGALKQIRYRDVPEKHEVAVVELHFAVQVAQAQKFLRDNKLREDRITVDSAAERIALDLSDTSMTDLSGIAGVKKLKKLILSNNKQIRDLRPLAGIINLELLNLVDTEITDLSGLEGAHNLKEMSLMRNRAIRDLGPLAGSEHLEKLVLNETKIADVRVLHGFKNLKELWVRDNRAIHDLAPLAGTVGLEYLFLSGTNITDKQIYELFRNHPNRENLKVRNSGGHTITYDKVHAAYTIQPAETKEIVPVLVRVVDALVDPVAAFKEAGGRFASEGASDEFNAIIASLKNDITLSEKLHPTVQAVPVIAVIPAEQPPLSAKTPACSAPRRSIDAEMRSDRLIGSQV